MSWRARLWLRFHQKPPKPYESYINALVIPVFAGYALGSTLYAVQNVTFGGYTVLTWQRFFLLCVGLLLLLLVVIGFFVWCVYDHKLSGVYDALAEQGRRNWEKKTARLMSQATQIAQKEK